MGADMEWAKGVSVDRVMFVASLLMRVQESGIARVPKTTGLDSPEHAISPREMRLGVTFIRQAGFGAADVIDEGEMWLISPWQVEA